MGGEINTELIMLTINRILILTMIQNFAAKYNSVGAGKPHNNFKTYQRIIEKLRNTNVFHGPIFK